MLQCCVHLSSVCRLWLCIVAKRCVQKLLLRAYRKSYIWEIDWYQNQWPWHLFRGRIKVMSTIEYIRCWISWKLLEIKAWFQRTTNREWYIGYQMVTWTMTSRDPRRCCEAVRSAILATAWLLVLHFNDHNTTNSAATTADTTDNDDNHNENDSYWSVRTVQTPKHDCLCHSLIAHSSPRKFSFRSITLW